MRKMVQTLLVDGGTFPMAWPHAKRLFEKLFSDEWEYQYDIPSLHQLIIMQQAQLWMANDEKEFFGAMVTQIVDYPTGITAVKVLWMAGADIDEIIPKFDVFEEWALKQGATVLEVTGRPGWEKKMRPLGFEKKYVTLSKVLKPETIH